LEYQVIERDSNILSQFQHDKPFVIGSGDALNVAVWRHDEISTDAVVTPDGKIFLPLIGEVNAAGFTVDELKQELNKKFADYIAEPHVTITVKEINSLKIYIIGEVSRSGEYKLDKSTDILQAISMAGGFTIYANKNKIDVIRKEGDKKIKIKFNYNEVVKGKNLEQNIILKPGDVIVVSESLW
jgi:polysaccharide export outer membrane protein